MREGGGLETIIRRRRRGVNRKPPGRLPSVRRALRETIELTGQNAAEIERTGNGTQGCKLSNLSGEQEKAPSKGVSEKKSSPERSELKGQTSATARLGVRVVKAEYRSG